jgi:uncharacterized protein (TIGR00369 family)
MNSNRWGCGSIHDMQRPTHTPANPDFEARVRESFARQAMMHTLGITIVDLGPGWIDLEFDHDDRFTQQHGFAHAGHVATALDSACGYAAFSLMPVNAAVLTVEYKINLLRPADATQYRASASVVKPGRTLTVSQGVVTPVDSTEAIATMTGTLMTLIDAGITH